MKLDSLNFTCFMLNSKDMPLLIGGSDEERGAYRRGIESPRVIKSNLKEMRDSLE